MGVFAASDARGFGGASTSGVAGGADGEKGDRLERNDRRGGVGSGYARGITGWTMPMGWTPRTGATTGGGAAAVSVTTMQ